jgi:hypothetical protein
MSKGSDSREFFEVFKAPENLQDAQKKEVKSTEESADVTKPKPSVPAPGAEEKAVNKPGISADPLGWIRNTRKEDISFKKKEKTSALPNPPSAASKGERILRKDEIVLRQETLVISVIVATFFSIACFFVGHKIGHNKGVVSQVEEWVESLDPKDAKNTGLRQFRPVAGDQKVTSTAVPQQIEKPTEQQKALSKDTWTLRAISYRNTKGNIERAKGVAKAIQNSLNYDSFVVDTGREILVCVGEFDARDSTDLTRAQKELAGFSYENKKPFKGCYPVRMR